MTMETAIVAGTTMGLEQIAEYSVIGAVAAIGLGFILWTAYNCSKNTKVALDNNTEAMRELKTSNEIFKATILAKLDK